MNRMLREVSACATGPARRETDGAVRMEFVFPPDFVGFEGHFPGNPIVPGIVQVMAGILTAGEGSPLRLVKVNRAKFVRIIGPGETIGVVATNTAKGGRINAAVGVTAGGETAASFTLVLEPVGGQQ